MMKRYEIIGIILTLLGATLWGVSGTSVQFVGNFRNMNLEWLLTMRLITAGLLTVLYGWIRQGNAVFNVFRNWRDTLGLVIFGVFGMALCQKPISVPSSSPVRVLRRCCNIWRRL